MTVPSLTSSGKSSRNFLDARDSRQETLAQALSKGYPATLFLSLNIPGIEKTPPGSEALFFWVLDELSVAFPGLQTLAAQHDALGPCAILGIDADPLDVKKRCIALETEHPSARLIDLDVYAADASQIDRKRLGLPGRSCLVCSLAAVECIRTKRHSFEEIISRVHELLALFRN